MAKLSYWVAKCRRDNDCYSLRGKTKKAVMAKLVDYDADDFDPVKKVTVEYADAFDLMDLAMSGENRGDWER